MKYLTSLYAPSIRGLLGIKIVCRCCIIIIRDFRYLRDFINHCGSDCIYIWWIKGHSKDVFIISCCIFVCFFISVLIHTPITTEPSDNIRFSCISLTFPYLRSLAIVLCWILAYSVIWMFTTNNVKIFTKNLIKIYCLLDGWNFVALSELKSLYVKVYVWSWFLCVLRFYVLCHCLKLVILDASILSPH